MHLLGFIDMKVKLKVLMESRDHPFWERYARPLTGIVVKSRPSILLRDLTIRKVRNMQFEHLITIVMKS
jgi:hypothetical protein